MNYSTTKGLADIQKSADIRGVAIDQVGVCDLKFPISVLDRENRCQTVTANVSMSVSLPQHIKGTHMSRFLEVLSKHQGEVTMRTLPSILHDLRVRLEADAAHIEVDFTYFLNRRAPVTGIEAPMDYHCTFKGRSQGSTDDFQLSVVAPATTLCPCSKEISDYGAHNQRGTIGISVRPRRKADGWELIWIEEIIAIAEKSASSPVYPILKRPDERHVTMQAFDNPAFVEDVVRNAVQLLDKNQRIEHFEVRAVNQESIHNHSAYAVVRSIGWCNVAL